jgi:hypothetical protein
MRGHHTHFGDGPCLKRDDRALGERVFVERAAKGNEYGVPAFRATRHRGDVLRGCTMVMLRRGSIRALRLLSVCGCNV